jgi:hypothetical protein
MKVGSPTNQGRASRLGAAPPLNGYMAEPLAAPSADGRPSMPGNGPFILKRAPERVKLRTADFRGDTRPEGDAPQRPQSVFIRTLDENGA